MKILLIVLLLFYIGCQDYNSNSFDRDLYSETELVGGPDFVGSYNILQKHCMGCHTHSQWSEYTNEQDWINRGLVVSGDAASSELIQRIWNSGAASADMPLGGGPLSASEYQSLVNWVSGI
ncbi:MAG: hypothetical protein ACLGHN_10180 [Bacteriovoracia bacterium]